VGARLRSLSEFESGQERWRSGQATVKFDFLGYCFRPRLVKRSRDNSLFCGFNPAVSPSALQSMRAKIRELGIHIDPKADERRPTLW
jgi:hypothetical protein